MIRFGNQSRLAHLSIICILLILTTQSCQFSVSSIEYQRNQRTCTKDLANMMLSESPPHTSDAEMAYDAESDRFVLFGRHYDSDWVAQTWMYDMNTNTWTDMMPSQSPPVVRNHKMVYDSESDLIVLFGGIITDNSEEYNSNQTWTYDLNSNTWTNMTASGSPNTSYDPCMTYDSDEDLILIVEGLTQVTWLYDVDTNTWDNVTPDVVPWHRTGASLAYDMHSKLSILYGGGWAIEGLGDTWAYNYTSNNWTMIAPSSSPGPCFSSPMVYDSHAKRVVLLSDDGSTYTYSSSEDEWYNMAPATSPPKRENSCMDYDSKTNQSVLFIEDDSNAEVWVYSYDDNIWTQRIEVPDDGTFCFIAYGDTRGDWGGSVSPLHDDIVNLFVQQDPEFVIHTGDMVRSGAEEYQWDDFNESIAALWSLGIPMYGAPGNHEVYSDGVIPPDEDLVKYKEFFDYSDVVDEDGETELFYSFDAGGIHFISLDTVHGWGDSIYTCPSDQMEWLESDLSNEHNCTIVFFHYPVWSVRLDRPDRWEEAEYIRNEFHDFFVDHGVDIVFNGHDHLYYRTQRDGIQYIIAGGGGAPLTDVQTEGTVWKEGDVGFGESHYCVAKEVDGLLSVEVFLLNGTIADTFSFEIPIQSDSTDNTLGVVIVSSFVIIAIVVMVLAIIRREQFDSY